MGRVVLVLGLILSVVGCGGIGWSFIIPFQQGIADAVNVDENAAALCLPNETLVTSEGASTYTQGQGYGRNVLYYCENSEGVQRDITGEVVENLIGDTVNTVVPGVVAAFIFGGLLTVGGIFTIIGIIIMIVRHMSSPVGKIGAPGHM